MKREKLKWEVEDLILEGVCNPLQAHPRVPDFDWVNNSILKISADLFFNLSIFVIMIEKMLKVWFSFLKAWVQCEFELLDVQNQKSFWT